LLLFAAYDIIDIPDGTEVNALKEKVSASTILVEHCKAPMFPVAC